MQGKIEIKFKRKFMIDLRQSRDNNYSMNNLYTTVAFVVYNVQQARVWLHRDGHWQQFANYRQLV